MLKMTGPMMDQFDEVDHFIVCVASSLRSDGSVTMLNGVAGALASKFPELPKAIGSFIQAKCGSCGTFGLRLASKVGVFQHSFLNKDAPNLELVSRSVKELKAHAEANPDKKYALESPHGSQPYWLVEGILKQLPDNVTVWLPS